MVTAILASIFLGGCGGNPRADELLARADSLMDVRPDSALTLLNEGIVVMDDSPESLRMRYCLLQAKAQNKAFQPFTSDSLMLAVADYYDRNGTANERMEAHYLLGCVYRDLGEAPRALTSYNNAVDCADTTAVDCNFALLSRVHGQMAVLLQDMQLPYEVIDECSKAERMARNAGDTLMLLSSYSMLANAFYLTADYNTSAVVSETASRLYLSYGDTLYSLFALKAGICSYLALGQIEQAKEALSKYERLKKYENLSVVKQSFKYYDVLKGICFLQEGKSDSAFHCLRYADIGATEGADKLILAKALAQYYTKVGVPDSALKYTEAYLKQNDTLYSVSVRRDFERMHNLYNSERSERLAEQRRAELMHTRAISAVVLSLVTIFAAIYYVLARRRNYKLQEHIRELNTAYTDSLEKYRTSRHQLASLQRSLESKETVLSLLRDTVSDKEALIDRQRQEVENYKAAISKKQESIDNLELAIANYQDDRQQPHDWNVSEDVLNHPTVVRLHKLAQHGQKPSDSDLANIRKLVEDSYPHFVPRLKEIYPQISAENILLCSLIKLRFIPSEMCVILQLKAQSVSNRRENLYKKFFKRKGGAKEFDHRIRVL